MVADYIITTMKLTGYTKDHIVDILKVLILTESTMDPNIKNTKSGAS
jgi:hypothetical protein